MFAQTLKYFLSKKLNIEHYTYFDKINSSTVAILAQVLYLYTVLAILVAQMLLNLNDVQREESPDHPISRHEMVLIAKVHKIQDLLASDQVPFQQVYQSKKLLVVIGALAMDENCIISDQNRKILLKSTKSLHALCVQRDAQRVRQCTCQGEFHVWNCHSLEYCDCCSARTDLDPYHMNWCSKAKVPSVPPERVFSLKVKSEKLEDNGEIFFAEGLALRLAKYFGKLQPSNVLDFLKDLPLEGYVYAMSLILQVDSNRFHMRCLNNMCQEERWLTEMGMISKVSVEYLREFFLSHYSDEIASDVYRIVIRDIIYEMHHDLKIVCSFKAHAKRTTETLPQAELLQEFLICTYRDLENCEKLDVQYLNKQIEEQISMIRKAIVSDGKCYFTGRVTRVCNLTHCLSYLLKASVCKDCTGFLACYCKKGIPGSN